MITHLRRGALAVLAVTVLATSAAPLAQAAKSPKPARVWHLSTPDRTVVDLPPTGPSIGDITVTSCDLTELPDSIAIGFCTTNQTTVRVNIPGGREILDVDLAISAPGGVNYATAPIRANSGTPPPTAQTFAITEGTGKYFGVAGQLVHSGFNAQGSKAEFYFTS